ncbi:MAG TPA: ATP-binding cassette domain-containing protein [Pseudobdellovibrionaceae bacterium]|nr:ATP-binding cassette domain-containing protein [Pseudobdellovibrionaceae bacterium]
MSRVRGLIKDYDGFRLEIPEMELSDQGVTVLRGPSGSGKTSVLRILTGLEACKSLEWWAKDNDKGNDNDKDRGVEINLAQLSVRDRRLGVVFQNYELFPHLSAKENLKFAADARGLDQALSQQRLQRLTDRLSLESVLDRRAEKLSGGEKQRVALARALIGQPRFLLLDEPFAALDQDLRADARRLLQQVLSEESCPALLVTHDPADVEALATKVIDIQAGRLTKR